MNIKETVKLYHVPFIQTHIDPVETLPDTTTIQVEEVYYPVDRMIDECTGVIDSLNLIVKVK